MKDNSKNNNKLFYLMIAIITILSIAIIIGIGCLIYSVVDFSQERKIRNKLCSQKVQATIVDYEYETSFTIRHGKYHAVYLFYYDNRKYCVTSKYRWFGFRRKNKKVNIIVNPHNPNMINDESAIIKDRIVTGLLWWIFIAVIYIIDRYIDEF